MEASSGALQATKPIPYYPNREEYEERSRYHEQIPHTGKDLPYGLPEKLESKMAWEGCDISLNQSSEGCEPPYLNVLEASQLLEIESALRYFQSEFASSWLNSIKEPNNTGCRIESET